MAWDKVDEELVKKAWVVRQYRSSQDLSGDAEQGKMVTYSDHELGSFVEKISGDDARMAWIHPGNGTEDYFPEGDNNIDWNIDEEEALSQEEAKHQ